MRAETIAIHTGQSIDPASGAIANPICLSTTFERAGDGSFPHGYEYGRDNNPNRHSLEICLAALEGGEEAIAFASGMAAISAAIESLPIDRPRRLVLPDDMYFGIRALLDETDIGQRFSWVAVDMTDLAAVEAACAQPIGMVWIETPSNPLIKIVDIAAVSRIGRAAGAVIAVDNTWATPLLQRPFELGADLVVHSLTKYVGGHSDVMIGAVVSKRNGAQIEHMRAIQKHKGAIPSPFDCWLALRGMQSLSPRMRMHCDNALTIAKFLDKHPQVSEVYYPGLASHPGHIIASRQMQNFGGMLSFIIKGGRAQALQVTANLRLIARATSLGGTHTLIEHRASVEGPNTMAPEGLLRLSVGLEHADDLIADLQAALDSLD
jgi:cystathionine gamma-synthase